MQTKFFCDLYVSEGWEKKKLKLIKKLQKNKLQPSVYVITLSQGKQNHLEYYSSLLLKQHIFDNASLFIVGIANGYDGALSLRKRRFEAYDTYPVSYTENNWMDSSFFARNFTLTDFNNLVLSGEIQIFCKRGEYT